ncbi:MAG: SIMPL domain-containing protein [Solirubrobacteraceae bacterium]
MRSTTWALGAVAALALAAPPAALADGTPSTLSVDGQGSTFVTPDVAQLTIAVSRSASASRAALALANRATDAVVASERALGVPGSGIQTQDVNVSSSTHRVGPHKRRVRRWTAAETLDVRLTQVALTGRAIDAATRAGASMVDGPTFSFADPSAGKLAATRAAIADARRRADDATAALGYQVTGVQSIQIDPQQNVEPPFAAAGAPSRTASTPAPTRVQPGRQEVDAEVAIVYTIAPL